MKVHCVCVRVNSRPPPLFKWQALNFSTTVFSQEVCLKSLLQPEASTSLSEPGRGAERCTELTAARHVEINTVNKTPVLPYAEGICNWEPSQRGVGSEGCANNVCSVFSLFCLKQRRKSEGGERRCFSRLLERILIGCVFVLEVKPRGEEEAGGAVLYCGHS